MAVSTFSCICPSRSSVFFSGRFPQERFSRLASSDISFSAFRSSLAASAPTGRSSWNMSGWIQMSGKAFGIPAFSPVPTSLMLTLSPSPCSLRSSKELPWYRRCGRQPQQEGIHKWILYQSLLIQGYSPGKSHHLRPV